MAHEVILDRVYPIFGHTQGGGLVLADDDRFYVYCLRKPSGEPFYVGKGRAYRLNAHFCPGTLKDGSFKSKIIKKYGPENCIREIVSYFDSEEEAYEMEEFLIESLGIRYDGGYLCNHMKSRNEIMYITEDGISKKVRGKDTYPDELILQVYTMWFTECLPCKYIPNITGMTERNVRHLVNGDTRKSLFSEFVDSGFIVNHRKGFNKVINSPCKFDLKTDELLVDNYQKYLNGEIQIRSIAKMVGLTCSHVSEIYQGKHRAYLGFDSKRELGTSRKSQRKYSEDRVREVYEMGLSPKEASKILGCTAPYYHALIKKYCKQER